MQRTLILFVCGLMVLASCAFAADPIGKWLLNEGTGTIAHDEMGNYNAPIQGNVSWITDVPPLRGLQNAVKFGGTAADYIALDSNSGVPAPTAVTVAFWAKATTNHSGQALLSKYWSVPGSFELGIGSAGSTYWRVWNAGGTQTMIGYTAGVDPFTQAEFNDGNWHFFAATASAADGAKIYVDGVLIDEGSMGGQGVKVTGNPLRVGGRSYPGAEAPFSGKMSTVWLFDVALSEAEILDLMTPSYGTVSGQAVLGDYNTAGDVSKQMAVSVVVEFLQGGNIVQRDKADVDASGNFATSVANAVPVGTYDVALVGSQFVRKVIPGVVIDGPVSLGPVTLVNGDVDGDNNVTSTDISVVLKNL